MIHLLIPIVVAVCSCCVSLPAQERPTKPKGRAKRVQYKRVHQDILKPLLQGNAAKSETLLRAALKADPSDPETRFLETIVAAARGDKAASALAMTKALQLGLPPGRFLAGPRELLAPIAEEPAFQRLLATHPNQLVHGPMLGHLTDSSVKVWVRTSAPTEVRLTVTPRSTDGPAGSVQSAAKTTAAMDYTCVVQVTGLRPSTDYTYQVRIAGQKQPRGGSFKTLHRHADRGRFTLAFGGGAGYVPKHERMWDTIRSTDPDLLLLLGDNIYSDAPKLSGMQRYCYYRRQSRSEFRQLVASTAVYSIWDDHDFGTNDCHGGPLPDKPPWKKDVYRVFTQNWPNPGFGIEGAAGCFYDFQAGGCHFLMLDGRCFRENPKKSDAPSMLGQLQLAWLRGRLKAGSGIFTFLCSPVPWCFRTKNNSLDTWNGFRKERDAIFAFLTRIKLEGVILLSADRHRTDVWKLTRPAVDGAEPYPLIELNSSRLTNQHVHPEMKAAEFSYNKKQSFGFLDINTAAADPTVEFKAVNIDGKVVHSRLIPRSSLRFQ